MRTAFLAGITGLTLSAAVSAAPVLVGTSTDPTGIEGLVVDGTAYDVTFSTQSYIEQFAEGSPAFLGNASGAADATTAVASFFNTVPTVTGLGNEPCTTYVCAVEVPYAIEYGFDVHSDDAALAGTWTTCNNNCNFWEESLPLGLGAFPNAYLEWAVFTPVAPVPIPASLTLLLSGLGGLATIRFSSRRAACRGG